MSTYDEQLAHMDAAIASGALAPQRSAAWLAERAGKATASRFGDVIAKLKSGAPAKARADYLWEIVVERLTGLASDHYLSAAMQWGADQELAARMAYEARTGALVEDAGFIHHGTLKNVGGSPDGLVGEYGGVETKCPFNSAIHLLTFLDGMPADHMPQVQGLMAVTGRAWWDFVSHDPRLPKPYDTYIERVARDEAFIANLEGELAVFLGDVDTMMARLKEAA